ncbi:autotransporter-associated beta strand repeat-containing protein [Escherichia coli]|nr:autotransporter-associated beta strand repeat-containing protein [Escherichia coli]
MRPGKERGGLKLAKKDNSLGVAWGLQRVTLDLGKALALTVPSGSQQTADFDAILDGAGGVSLDAGSGTLVFGNVSNSYSGPTDLKSGTLALAVSHALGNTSALTLAENTVLDVQGSTQSAGTLNTATGSRINLGGGKLTLTAGGQIDGAITGVGTLNFSGGTTQLTSSGNELMAQIRIAGSADVELLAGDSLGSGAVCSGQVILATVLQ